MMFIIKIHISLILYLHYLLADKKFNKEINEINFCHMKFFFKLIFNNITKDMIIYQFLLQLSVNKNREKIIFNII